MRVLVPVVLASIAPVLVWAQQGVPLGPEFRVNTETVDDQSSPSIASDSAGNFVVVWAGNLQDGSGRGILGQRYDSSGAPLGPEFRVNSYTTGDQYGPVVAVSATGSFIVAWQSIGEDGSLQGVFGQRYGSSGTPLGSEFGINTYTTGNQTRPAVAVDSTGNFVVVWDGPSSAGYGVIGQRYAASGSPLGAEFRVNASGGAAFASVASDGAGDFVVAWQALGEVFGQRFANDGTPSGPMFRVNTYTTFNQVFSAVSSSAAGDFIVVWSSQGQEGEPGGGGGGPPFGIYAQRYSSGGVPAGPEFHVNTYTTGNQWFPAVAADTAGHFVVVWAGQYQDGSNYGVFGQRYASSGVPVGPEFRINTHTTGSQMIPSVAADSAGEFVVAWHSDLQDGSGYGIFAQRYGQIVPVELMGISVE